MISQRVAIKKQIQIFCEALKSLYYTEVARMINAKKDRLWHGDIHVGNILVDINNYESPLTLIDVNPIITCEEKHQKCFRDIRDFFIEAWRPITQAEKDIDPKIKAVREVTKSIRTCGLFQNKTEVKEWEDERIWKIVKKLMTNNIIMSAYYRSKTSDSILNGLNDSRSKNFIFWIKGVLELKHPMKALETFIVGKGIYPWCIDKQFLQFIEVHTRLAFSIMDYNKALAKYPGLQKIYTIHHLLAKDLDLYCPKKPISLEEEKERKEEIDENESNGTFSSLDLSEEEEESIMKFKKSSSPDIITSPNAQRGKETIETKGKELSVSSGKNTPSGRLANPDGRKTLLSTPTKHEYKPPPNGVVIILFTIASIGTCFWFVTSQKSKKHRRKKSSGSLIKQK